MADLFTIQNLGSLIMLILLQAVLGFDNLLYISLESKKAPKEAQSKVRRIGILLAIGLRIGLLFLLVSVIEIFQSPFWSPQMGDIISNIDSHGNTVNVHQWFEAEINVHSLIVLFGGVFIIYTAIKEIWHMISHEQIGADDSQGIKTSSAVIGSIVFMNVIFSFDSILSAMALTSTINNSFVEMTLMTVAIVTSGILMIVLADKVSEFLRKNRMFEVLGLFVLLIVGVMLLTEGGHIAKIAIFGNDIVPMSKTTFYFVIVVLVLVDIIQTKYQKKIIKREEMEEAI